jgi:hypothetical protein
MWDELKNMGSKKRTNSPIKRHTMKGNGTMGKTFQKGKNPNNFKAWALNPKENLSKRVFFSKGVNPRGTLMGSPTSMFQLQ